MIGLGGYDMMGTTWWKDLVERMMVGHDGNDMMDVT